MRNSSFSLRRVSLDTSGVLNIVSKYILIIFFSTKRRKRIVARPLGSWNIMFILGFSSFLLVYVYAIFLLVQLGLR